MASYLDAIIKARDEFRAARQDEPRFICIDALTYLAVRQEFKEREGDLGDIGAVYGLRLVVVPDARALLRVVGTPYEEALRSAAK